MEGTVTKRSVSKNGNPVITVDGKAYVVGPQNKLDVSGIRIGDRISFEAHAFGDGNVWGMDSYRLLESAQKYPPSQQPSAPIASHNGSGVPTEGERLTLSNWIGQGIASGAIKTPEEVDSWYRKLRALLRSE